MVRESVFIIFACQRLNTLLHFSNFIIIIIIIIIIIYTPAQVHRVTMVGGGLKVTTSMYRR